MSVHKQLFGTYPSVLNIGDPHFREGGGLE